jgi:acetyl-CoA carboxylase biotin carboxylase subunit
MVRKLLIANRGEIARRIIRTCKKLGIATVAVYSDADMKALHRLEADESVHIGPSPVAQSYLQIERIVEAAKSSGADAVHPGYGLLSENALFASACRAAGLLFVGPNDAAIEQMGSKTKARGLMQRAGVPVVPGSEGSVDSVHQALQVAHEIGYPVMLKAAHGGGGIGMQAVSSDEELQKAFLSNQARAKAYFGNGEMFIEKYIRDPRHIEIQVLFDAHGHGIHLFERECSVQRRHQKVVEEALSPFVDEDLRERMGRAALVAANAIGYENAGTVEFLVDADRNFYFLEMNTRLQVEHPVTECITGLDLVEWQIRVACGEKLPFHQKDLSPSGHAIECRIYAEDPDKLLPSPGKITALELPTGIGIRNDVGVEAGSEVTPFYDPMIGKLIAYGQDRAEAISRMRQALTDYRVEGIKTNIPLLRQILSAEAFERGETTTSFISELQRRT